jgi:hypothetical protein
LFICVVGVVSKGTYVGIGAPDERLNDNMQRDGRMVSTLSMNWELADSELIVHLAVSNFLLQLFDLYQRLHLRHPPSNRYRKDASHHRLGDTRSLGYLNPHRHHWTAYYVSPHLSKLGQECGTVFTAYCHYELELSRICCGGAY